MGFPQKQVVNDYHILWKVCKNVHGISTLADTLQIIWLCSNDVKYSSIFSYAPLGEHTIGDYSPESKLLNITIIGLHAITNRYMLAFEVIFHKNYIYIAL